MSQEGHRGPGHQKGNKRVQHRPEKAGLESLLSYLACHTRFQPPDVSKAGKAPVFHEDTKPRDNKKLSLSSDGWVGGKARALEQVSNQKLNAHFITETKNPTKSPWKHETVSSWCRRWGSRR